VDNTANREGHMLSTGPEIWAQTNGKVDGFTCAIGTGGTLAGVSHVLEEQKQENQNRSRRPARRGDVLAGSSMAELESEGSSITEGIGQGRVNEKHRGRTRRRRLPDPGLRSPPFGF
jgi:cysteine synthase A